MVEDENSSNVPQPKTKKINLFYVQLIMKVSKFYLTRYIFNSGFKIEGRNPPRRILRLLLRNVVEEGYF